MTIARFELLSREEVSQILGQSFGTVDKLIEEGSIPPPHRIGSCRKLYWHHDVFWHWLDAHMRADSTAVTNVKNLNENEESGGSAKTCSSSRDNKIEKSRTPDVSAAQRRQIEKITGLNE